MIFKTLKASVIPYLEKKILVSMIMGFVSGLPLLLTITLLQAWLTDENISKSTIGLFALIGLPYSLKFLWAPLFDRRLIAEIRHFEQAMKRYTGGIYCDTTSLYQLPIQRIYKIQ